MHPVLFRIGELQVETYGVVVVFSFAIMVAFAARRGARDGLDAWRLAAAIGWGTIGSIIGGRLVYALVNPGFIARDPLVFFTFWEGGLVSVGGLFGMQIGVGAYALWSRMPFGKALDLAALCGALALALGRWGCFFAGCDYGAPAGDLPWAVTFTDSACLVPEHLRGIPLHPVQLYLAAAHAAIFALGLAWHGRGAPPGRIFGLVALSYSVARFGIETLRGDPDRGVWFDGSLSTAQLAVIPWALVGAMAVLTAGRGVWIRGTGRSTTE